MQPYRIKQIHEFQTRICTSLFLGCLFLPAATSAQPTYFQESDKTVATIGAQADYFYVRFVEPLTQNCQYGLLYISASNKGLYTQLMTASLTGRKILRLDYAQPDGNGGACTAQVVEFRI